MSDPTQTPIQTAPQLPAQPAAKSRHLITLVRELGAALFLILLCGYLLATKPAIFGSASNIKNVLVQISAIAICGAGMTFVIIAGGIDLSVGSVLAMAGFGGAWAGFALSTHGPAWIMRSGMAVPIGIAVGLLIGALIGWINGILLTKLHLPPFIMTLGTMSIARGLAFEEADIAKNQSMKVIEGIRLISTARPMGIPFPIFLMAGVFIVCWFMLRYTRIGRYSFAIGGNEEAARLSGVAIDRYKIIVYTLCGLLAAVSGLITAGRLAYMSPQVGDGFELDVIAAVVIGGTSLAGGSGSIVYTLLGALIMGVVRNGLDLNQVNYNLQKLIIGLIIIAAVAVDVFTKKQSEKA